MYQTTMHADLDHVDSSLHQSTSIVYVERRYIYIESVTQFEMKICPRIFSRAKQRMAKSRPFGMCRRPVGPGARVWG